VGLTAEDANMARRLLGSDDKRLRGDLGMSDLQISGVTYSIASKAEAAGCADLAAKLRARAARIGE
jgi:hypothetical protein